MKILVVDVGGTNIKVLASGQDEPLKIPSGPDLTAARMVAAVRQATEGWDYEVVSIGYPGPVSPLRTPGRPREGTTGGTPVDNPSLAGGKILADPVNLGAGWIDFDFEAEFGRPVKVINDAAMQALGSYRGGTMLFLGLGTGLGTALVVDHTIVPMELAHLGYKKATFEEYLGVEALRELGKKKWTRQVHDVVAELSRVFLPDDIVLGGGNTKKLKDLPPGCRAVSNRNAFVGGFRLWEPTAEAEASPESAETEPNGSESSEAEA